MIDHVAYRNFKEVHSFLVSGRQVGEGYMGKLLRKELTKTVKWGWLSVDGNGSCKLDNLHRGVNFRNGNKSLFLLAGCVLPSGGRDYV